MNSEFKNITFRGRFPSDTSSRAGRFMVPDQGGFIYQIYEVTGAELEIAGEVQKLGPQQPYIPVSPLDLFELRGTPGTEWSFRANVQVYPRIAYESRGSAQADADGRFFYDLAAADPTSDNAIIEPYNFHLCSPRAGAHKSDDAAYYAAIQGRV